MKKNTIACTALASLFLASSCSSSYQASAGVTGAVIGGHVGETVGFLSGHGRFRGENAALGNLIGMGVGAILGVSVANQIEKNAKAAYNSSHDGDADYQTSSDADYQTGGGAGYDEGKHAGDTYRGTSSQSYALHSGLEVSDLTYTDSNGDGMLSKNEVIEVESIITNTTDKPMAGVTIWLDVDNVKSCIVSPSLTTSIEPGEKLRYTGRIFCKKARQGGSVTVSLTTSHAGLVEHGHSMTIGLR